MGVLKLPVGRVKLRSYHLSPAECATIYQFIRQGHSPFEVAARFAISAVSVRRVAKRLSDGEIEFTQHPIKDEVNKIYGKLTVLSFSHRDRGAWFNCLCQCGNTVKVRGYQLRRGKTKSCGCLLKRPAYEIKKQRTGAT